MSFRNLSHLEQEADSWDYKRQQKYLRDSERIKDSDIPVVETANEVYREFIKNNGKKSPYDRASKTVEGFIAKGRKHLKPTAFGLATVMSLGITLVPGTSHTSAQEEGVDPSLEARAEILGYESGVGGAEPYFSNTLQPDSWGQTSRSGITLTASEGYQFLHEETGTLPLIKIKWRESTHDTLSHSKFKKCTGQDDLMLLNPLAVPTYEGPKMYPGRAPTSNNLSK